MMYKFKKIWFDYKDHDLKDDDDNVVNVDNNDDDNNGDVINDDCGPNNITAQHTSTFTVFIFSGIPYFENCPSDTIIARVPSTDKVVELPIKPIGMF
jgi:hypothetical protein